MNFLNPAYLLAAFAAVVPLVIHLLHRQRARIQVFPSLEFLRQMMRKRTRRFRLKQILLLIARTLLLLTIGIALAGPTLRGGRAARGHLPTAAAVLIDDSFSMTRRAEVGTLFDVAKTRTLQLLRCFGPGDEVHVFTTSSPSRDLSEARHDAEGLRRAVSEMAPTGLTTDFGPPVRQAMSVLSASDKPTREIYLISDMQASGWAGVTETALGGEGLGGDIKVLLVDLGRDDANACVKDVAFRMPSGTDDVDMEVAFERYGSVDLQGRVAEVFLRGTLFSRCVFSPGEGGSEKEAFRIPPFDGFMWGEVAMAEDDLKIDDRRYFALPSRRRVVGIVGEAFYIAAALSPEGGGVFEIVSIEEGAINRESLSGLDILVAANVPRFSPIEIGAIRDFVAAGGSVFVFLGNRVDTGDYNRNLLPLFGETRLEAAARGGRDGFYTIDRFDKRHRVFAKFKPDQSPFADARFDQFVRTDPGGARTLAWLSDGSPAMIEVHDRFALFTSAADPAWSDFVLTPQFLPLLHETLLYLTSEVRLGQAYLLGEEIAVRTGRVEGEVLLDGPSGAARLFPQTAGEARGWRIDPPRQPGVYFLKSPTETLSVFAVNVDVAESDIVKATPEGIASRLGRFEVRTITERDNIGESVALLRQGRDLSGWFLRAGLLLIVFETLLASNLPVRLRQTQDDDLASS